MADANKRTQPDKRPDPNKRKKSNNRADRDLQSLAEQDRRALQEMSRKFLLRLRRAYRTLLTALALYLPKSSKPSREHSNRFRWLNRMWWELTLCGYATGRLVMQFIDEKMKDGPADSYVISQLKWLNKTGGIEESKLDFKVKQHLKYFSEQYKAIRKLRRKDPAQQALLRWRELMLQAMTKAAASDLEKPKPRIK